MAQHSPLGPASGATGVEQPSRVLRHRIMSRNGLARAHFPVLAVPDLNDLSRVLHVTLDAGHRLARGRVGETQAGPRMLQNVLDLRSRKLRVDGNSRQPSVPAGKQDLRIFRAVAHRERDPVTGSQTELPGETAGQRGDSRRHAPVVEENLPPASDGWVCGKAAGASVEEMGERHGAIPLYKFSSRILLKH